MGAPSWWNISIDFRWWYPHGANPLLVCPSIGWFQQVASQSWWRQHPLLVSTSNGVDQLYTNQRIKLRIEFRGYTIITYYIYTYIYVHSIHSNIYIYIYNIEYSRILYYSWGQKSSLQVDLRLVGPWFLSLHGLYLGERPCGGCGPAVPTEVKFYWG